jgi:beta-1,4-mannosyl-glycoprotein beta-1,4-N-acetylglucosaminyltransferase
VLKSEGTANGTGRVMKIFDCFTFCNELDILEIRLHELTQVVDHFVLVEAPATFTRRPKKLHFLENKDRFSAFAHKIIHVTVPGFPRDLQPGMPCERFQRDQIGQGLVDAMPEDLVLISDVDAIPSASSIEAIVKGRDYAGAVIFYEMPVYNFKLNWRTRRSKRRFETRVIEKRNFPGAQRMHDFRALVSRSIPEPLEAVAWKLRVLAKYRKPLRRVIINDEGWHFSFMSNNAGIRDKIRAYSHFDREVGDNMSDNSLESRRNERQSMHGNPVVVEGTENLPAYVRGNLQRFGHILELGAN